MQMDWGQITSLFLAVGIGFSMGVALGTREITVDWWKCVKEWYWSKRLPQLICPHVSIDRSNGEVRVASTVDENDRCWRCGGWAGQRDMVNRNLAMWEANPAKAEKRIRAAEKAAIRRNGWG